MKQNEERRMATDILEQQYKEVIHTYKLVIFRVCTMYASEKAPVMDLYQETLINIWKGYPKFRGESKLSTWIYRVAINSCITFMRKERNAPEYVHINEQIENYLPQESDEKKEMLKQLYRMISKLEPLEKSIILLYLEEKNYDEISEIVGLSSTNVGTKINRIKEKLKKMNKKEQN